MLHDLQDLSPDSVSEENLHGPDDSFIAGLKHRRRVCRHESNGHILQSSNLGMGTAVKGTAVVCEKKSLELLPSHFPNKLLQVTFPDVCRHPGIAAEVVDDVHQNLSSFETPG